MSRAISGFVRPLLLGTCILALAGCFESSTLEIRPRASLEDSTGLAGLVLVTEGRVVRAADYRRDRDGIAEVTLDVPDDGRLRIQFVLSQAGRSVVNGTFGWEMAPDYEWGMDVFRQVGDPRIGCFGCSGTERVAIPSEFAVTEGEALWFVWGGKPKGSDIVF